ncbi:MAG: response regulator, partial [Nitrospinota bacterium]
LSQYLDAKVGAFYVVKGDTIQLTGSYAFSIRKGFRKEFAVGEGMIGQAAQGKQTLVFSDIPDDYLTITSGLGETRPRIITICPVVWDNEVLALLEFGTITSLSTLHKNLVEAVTPAIAVAVQTSMSREQTKELLEQTQNQAEELRAREEELRDTNRILERQARELKRSEVLLRSNHAQMEDRNRQLQSQQLELEQKAKDLALSSKYKSEFLANMSHELRTPLNSMLILSQLLSENKNGNLSEKQVEFARTIHASGADLVALIHDILDLSKVEAGKMNMNVEPVALDAFISALESKFRPVAENKGISLKFEVAPPPEPWQCDSQKLGQIVKNLLSNAIKFTEKGGVTLRLALAKPGTTFETPGLKPEATLAIEVIDSGIGIAGEKRAIIFEAFQQADGTTSRKFGGTGLGLSISRELAKLLGGEIHVESTPGQGSTFTLFVPLTPTPVIPVEAKDSAKTPSSENGASGTTGTVQEPEQGDARSLPAHTPPTEEPDDRDEIKPEDRSILVIEDDSRFASVVAESARSRGFKVLLSCTGKNGLHLADHFTPSGIVLDIELPNIDGWEVLQRLKRSPKTRHIPVCFVSANESSVDAIKNGAVGFLSKPAAVEDVEFALGRIEGVIDRAVRRLLLVDKDPGQIERVRTLVGGGDIEIVEAKTGAEAKKQLSEGGPDCIAMDIRLPDMNGLDLLDTLRTDTALQQIPVVVYTGKEMGPHERNTLNRYSQSIAIKDVHS